MRSLRLREPVLICPLLVATAMSAMVESSVSPERWEVTVVYPWRCAISMASNVSLSEPIWFTLMRMELPGSHGDAFLQEFHVGHEEVVSHQLAALSDSFGQFDPILPIVFVQPVLDGVDRVFCDQVLEEVYLLGCAEFLSVRIFLLPVLKLFVVIEILSVLDHSEFACFSSVCRPRLTFFVYGALFQCGESLECWGDYLVHVLDRLERSLAKVTALVPVT